MREVKYLSPTSIGTWESDPKEYYLRYLADSRPDKLPQTKPMSAGSAFDAYVKSYLHERLFGANSDPRYTFESLFETQVESQNRDWARTFGLHAFQSYRTSGALSDLMLELAKSKSTPRFEFDLQGYVGDMILMGKPDCSFTNDEGAHILLDWKVNNSVGTREISPAKGYVKIRDGWVGSPSKKANAKHRDAIVMNHKGVMINVANNLEDTDRDWARQLSIYAWLIGEPVGSDFIVAIDQLVCSPGQKIKVAEHRTRVSPKFQLELYKRALNMWNIIHSDHIFHDMSKEESQEQCRILDGFKNAFDATPWFNDLVRR